jgi:hypothetical protein
MSGERKERRNFHFMHFCAQGWLQGHEICAAGLIPCTGWLQAPGLLLCCYHLEIRRESVTPCCLISHVVFTVSQEPSTQVDS